MMKPLILLVEDEENFSYFLQEGLKQHDYEVVKANSVKMAQKMLNREQPDLLILDLKLPDGDGLDVYRTAIEMGMDLPTLVITAYASLDSAIEALKLGVNDYIIKPIELKNLVLLIERQLENRHTRLQLKYLLRRLQNDQTSNFYHSVLPEVKALEEMAIKIAGMPEGVILLEGESGTGKDMLAKLIHAHAPNPESPFVEINCGSLPQHLLESELFGYEPGAFTDAKKRKIGLFEVANGGTIFLDEISELPADMQVKLLHVLENKKIRRLGGLRDINLKLRIITATNRNLKELMEKNLFRHDLYYRLNVFKMRLPALRERKGELLLLAQFLLEKIAKTLQKEVRFLSKEVEKYLLDYDWPGNIRELKNALERAVILCEGDTVLPEHLPPDLLTSNKDSLKITSPSLTQLGSNSLREYLGRLERDLFLQAWSQSGFNQVKTAQLLNEPRHVVRYLIEKYVR